MKATSNVIYTLSANSAKSSAQATKLMKAGNTFHYNLFADSIKTQMFRGAVFSGLFSTTITLRALDPVLGLGVVP